MSDVQTDAWMLFSTAPGAVYRDDFRVGYANRERGTDDSPVLAFGDSTMEQRGKEEGKNVLGGFTVLGTDTMKSLDVRSSEAVEVDGPQLAWNVPSFPVAAATSSPPGPNFSTLPHYSVSNNAMVGGAPPPSAPSQRDRRLHQDFKALSKAERQRCVQWEAAASDLLERTVHLRFLPVTMKQGELADLCRECGNFLRVRICGNACDNQNWIYGFVEFETKEGAENLMRLNGIELMNGEGRHALRLKCNKANQPIVDRVFHDADPASRNPCIFGQGNYANRTLKDALDSYFNLKAKEKRQAAMGGAPNNGNRESHPLPPVPPSTVVEVHGPANPSAGAEMQVQGGEPASGDSSGRKSIAQSLRVNAQPFIPTTNSVHSNVSSQPSEGYQSSAAEEAHRQDGPQREPSVSNPPSPDLLPAPSARRMPAPNHAREKAPLNPQIVPGLPTGGVMNGVQLLPTAVAPPATMVRVSLPPSAFPSSFAAAPQPPEGNSEAWRVDEVGGDQADALSRALTSMMESQAVLSGEEVVDVCCSLIQQAFQEAFSYISCSPQSFEKPVSTLNQLLSKLNANVALTGRAVDAGARDSTSDLPQKATQLRLLANLMLGLLYCTKRSVKQGLPYFCDLLQCVREISLKPLVPPSVVLPYTPPPAALAPQEGLLANLMAEAPPDGVMAAHPASNGAGFGVDYRGVSTPPRAVEDGVVDTFPSSPNSDCKGLLEEVLGEEEDPRPSMHIVPTFPTCPPFPGAALMKGSWEHQMPLEPVSGDELQSLYLRDVTFHRYVLHVLVAAGLALEEVLPSFSTQFYSLALLRGRKVLNVHSEVVKRCADGIPPTSDSKDSRGGAFQNTYPRLADEVAGLPSGEESGVRDVAAFSRHFFQLAFLNLSQPNQDEAQWWGSLPPANIINFFPAPTC